jgi:hypothetical protein
MKRLLIAACMLAGCAGAEKQVEEHADKACACRDKACANKAWSEFLAWAEANKDARGDDQAAERQVRRMTECLVAADIDPALYEDGKQRLIKLAQ